MERVLNGKPRRSGMSLGEPHADGGDSPAWSRKRQPYEPTDERPLRSAVAYAELHAHSAYSFLDGASTPEELVEEAVRLDLRAVALTDHDGLYGVVRFAEAAKELDMRTVFGAELSLSNTVRTEDPDPPGPHLLVLARGPEGYRRLSRQLAAAHLAGGVKGRPLYDYDTLTEAAGGHWHILTGCRKGHVRQALSTGGPEAAAEALADLVDRFGRDRVSVELTHHGDPLDDERNAALAALAGPEVRADGGRHHRRAFRRARPGPVGDGDGGDPGAPVPGRGGGPAGPAGRLASALRRRDGPAVLQVSRNGHRRSRSGRAVCVRTGADRPQLPPFDVPEGHTEDSWLRELVMVRAARRYGPRSSAPEAYAQIERGARRHRRVEVPGLLPGGARHHPVLPAQRHPVPGKGIGGQLRGLLRAGVTAVDPIANELLFERFLSPARDGPPDIDIDIESDLRERAIQYVYDKYGRDYAAQVANVITYRAAARCATWPARSGSPRVSRMPGANRSAAGTGWTIPRHRGHPRPVIDLAMQIKNLPRHMGIHSGGMVICDRPIADVCPVEWARMADRSVLQWDKDDCAAIGLVKFDLLGLGMLSALHYAIDLIAEHKGIEVDLARLDLSDPAVYEMLQRADSVGCSRWSRAPRWRRCPG